ncbi:hypothetical protein TNIN_433231 [Trichonephila inaurata madagascariensis]|uniref:Uncharacterized protein n=1 Tax=Trichonephila inaurata madagascariensis TaxID=2747483 RepID=A0A8X6XDW4_9ARAC|nr:hypothetical protein TNIN_433231 [Trichonephila inaurata madagascariensis]
MGSQTLFYFFVLAAIFFLVSSHDGDGHYTNDWVVRLIGGKDVVDQLAMELDYQNLGEFKQNSVDKEDIQADVLHLLVFHTRSEGEVTRHIEEADVR